MSPLTGESRLWRVLRLLGDVAAALAAFSVAFLVRIYLPVPFTRGFLPGDRLLFLAREWPAVALAQVATLYFFAFYDAPRPRSRPEIARRLAAAVTVQGLALTGWLFFANRDFPRSVLVLYVLLDLVALFAWRVALDRRYRRRERRVAIVGAGSAAREVAAALALHHWHGLTVVGHVPIPGEPLPWPGEPPLAGAGAEPGRAPTSTSGTRDFEAPPRGGSPGHIEEGAAVLGPCLGGPEDLPGLLAEGRIDDIILAGSADSWQTRLIDALARARPDHTNVLLLPGPFESLIGRMRYRWVHDLPLIEVVRESEWRLNRPVKRLLDLAAGSFLLVVSLPVTAGVAAAVAATSRGPVLYRQERVGRSQRRFTLLKFRTMRQDAEAETGEILAQPGDPRLTPIGAFLRRFRLDELPQLLNVLGGSMSLVGPRPERPGFVQRYLREVPGYAERFSLAPGLTGLAQVNGDYHSSPQNKLRYDLAYMANWSLWLDLSILLRTVKIVLTSRGV